jgi:hypothetical protein
MQKEERRGEREEGSGLLGRGPAQEFWAAFFSLFFLSLFYLFLKPKSI